MRASGSAAPVGAGVGAAILPRRLVAALALGLSFAVAPLPACSRRAPSPSVGDKAAAASPKVTVRDDSEGLLLTWIDDKGDFHVEQKVKDVPAMGRDVVKVVDPTNEETAQGDRIVVADLRAPRADGAYSVSVMARSDFDGLALTRRQKHGPTLASPLPSAALAEGAGSAAPAVDPDPSGATAQGDGPGAPRPAVIIYGASWCGACHEAAAYLKRRGIQFIEKDIEADRLAAREMQTKLTRAGLRGGSIPVIDVRGHVMVGFNPQAIEEAMGKPL